MNILWICTDQQRWDTLGCYGNPLVKTPHLDELSGHGVLFERCYSQSPVCTPSRASFLTGRYPRTCRCRQNGQNIPGDEVLVTRLLADAGYTCGLSGKLHISACHPSVCTTMERRTNDGYRAFHWSHHGGSGWETHNEYWAWLAEKGAMFNTPAHPLSMHVRQGMPEELHQTTWCVEKAIDFIHARKHDRAPWLFSVNIYDPHHQFDPPGAYLDRYMPLMERIPLPKYVPGELLDKPVYQQQDHEGAYGTRGYFAYDKMTENDHKLVRASYWAMCDLIDAQVGRLLAALEESGMREQTMVIFTSDHGEMLGDHGIYLKGPYFYEPAIHVPLIISLPGHIQPFRSRALVELTDLAQTILDTAGLPHHPGMQGRSLWPLLTGRVDPHCHRDDVLCEYYAAMARKQGPKPYLNMVRTGQHKLVVDHGRGGELYDLVHDPAETKNLWNDAAQRAVKEELLARLCDRIAFTVDPLPPRVAEW